MIGSASRSAHSTASAGVAERRALDLVLTELRLPEGWCTLRCEGRLDARWRSEDGRWARITIKVGCFDREQNGEKLAGVHARFGEVAITATLASSDLGATTSAAFREFLVALDRVLLD